VQSPGRESSLRWIGPPYRACTPARSSAAADFDVPLAEDLWAGQHESVARHHAFIWWDSNPGQFSRLRWQRCAIPRIRYVHRCECLGDGDQGQLGKLTLRLPLPDIIAQQQANGLQVLPATLAHSLELEGLPAIHKGPLRSVLVAQTSVEDMELVSGTNHPPYPVRVVW